MIMIKEKSRMKDNVNFGRNIDEYGIVDGLDKEIYEVYE